MNVCRWIFPLLAISISFSAIDAKDLEFFLQEEAVQFRLEAPITSLRKQRGENPGWMPGMVGIKDASGNEQQLDVQIKARGNNRRKKSSCSFPSYWINFKKKQVKGTVFDGLDKVKVVAHCREGRKSFEHYIYKEYLAYKTYGLLTDRSFRVRLVTVEYVDTEGKYGPKTFVAFVIEHVDDLAKRMGSKQVKDRYILPDLYNEKALCLAEMFQFFIGNCDFSFFASLGGCCHNGKVFALEKGGGEYVPVPYDFDMTGIVDVPYAIVNSKLPIKSVTDRYYRGLRTSDEIFQETLGLYIEKKDEIIALWENTPYLSKKEKEKPLEFIEEFYEILGDPGQLKAKIERRMRSRIKLEELLIKRIEEAKE